MHVDRVAFEAYNEGGDLVQQIEAYRRRYGCYPAVEQADKIYRSRANRRFCTEKNIRLSGPALGRPRAAERVREEQKQILRDERERVEVEGGVGELKRRYSWDQIRAHLVSTAITWICLSVIAHNLEKAYRAFLSFFYFVPETLILDLANSFSVSLTYYCQN